MENHSEIKLQSKIIPFEKCLDFLERAGKAYFNPGFQIHPEDHELIFQLLVYFYGDQANAKKYGLNLRKGILLTGPVGCGKTTLMFLMRFFLAEKEQHVMKSTRQISFEFIQEGYAVINRYSRTYYTKGGEMHPKTYCFDDLGVESNIKYYGNDTNVMAEILLSRYDLFVSRRMLTHATTNLNAGELEEMYGNRVRSRMREMFNLVSFPQSSKDKRI